MVQRSVIPKEVSAVKKPNFLMVGAPKAGTTSIANYLNEHPEIFISKEKEPFYFLPNILEETSKTDPMYDAIEKRAHLSPEGYYALFQEAINEKKIGEATVHYLYHYKEVIPRVKNELGDIPIIIVLRDPSDRAFSNYKFQSRGQLNSFETALELELERKKMGYNSLWFYKEVGLYALPVKAYLENFTNVHICLFEDLKENPIKFMQAMYAFLEVEAKFVPKIEVQHNLTLVPKNKLLHAIYYFKNKYGFHKVLPKRFKKKFSQKAFKKNEERIHPDTRKQLQEYFKSDIQQVEEITNMDLSAWYSHE